MGGGCNAHGGKVHTGFLWGEKNGGNRPIGKNIGVHGRIILNSILKK
jgi:hypothetical protein